MSKTWCIIDLIHWSESYFKDREFASPRSEIEWLLCSLLECNRLDLYMRFDEPLSRSQLSSLRAWVKRRLKHEPLQYITGSCDFYGRPFVVSPDVLIPRPETEILIDEAIKCIQSIKAPKILDIGTGSGCIAITMAIERSDSIVLAVDTSVRSLSVAKRNSAILQANNLSFKEMNIKRVIPEGRFDLIVSNPPYISKKEMDTLMTDVKDFEPDVALTDFDDGLTFYRRFADILPTVSNTGSSLVLEVGLGKHPRQAASIFKEAGYSDIDIVNDYNGDQRVLIIRT